MFFFSFCLSFSFSPLLTVCMLVYVCTRVYVLNHLQFSFLASYSLDEWYVETPPQLFYFSAACFRLSQQLIFSSLYFLFSLFHYYLNNAYVCVYICVCVCSVRTCICAYVHIYICLCVYVCVYFFLFIILLYLSRNYLRANRCEPTKQTILSTLGYISRDRPWFVPFSFRFYILFAILFLFVKILLQTISKWFLE